MLWKKEKDEALSLLEPVLFEISKVYRECNLAQGKGAMLVYAYSVINGCIPNEHDYRTREEILEIFDDINSKASLAELLNKYEPRSEGLLVLITSFDNATLFITVKLKSRRKANKARNTWPSQEIPRAPLNRADSQVRTILIVSTGTKSITNINKSAPSKNSVTPCSPN